MIKKFKEKLLSKNGRALVENFISLSALQMLGIVLPLLTLPYLIRVLGVSNYGIIVLAGALINYFTSITDYSFKITATRDVAVFRHSIRKLSLIYSKVQSVKAILLIFSTSVISIIVFLYPPFYKESTVFFLSIPMLFGYTIFPEWFFQGIEKMKYITYLNAAVKVFFTLCVFIFIKHQEDYWIYPLLQSLGFIGAGVVAQYILVSKYKIKFYWLPRRIIIKTLKANFPIFINQFLPTFYNNTSTFLLGILTNTALVGTYDAIKKIIDLLVLVISIISRVCFPYLNRRRDSFIIYKRAMLVIGAVFSIVPLVFSKWIFLYLNIKNTDAFNVIMILSVGVFFMCLYDIFGVNYFIIRRYDRLVMYNTVVASIIGLVLAFPLIFYFNIMGAAMNLTFSRGLMGGGLFYRYLRNKE